jgi:glutaredoxin
MTVPTEQVPAKKGPGIKLAAIVLIAVCGLALFGYLKFGNKPKKPPVAGSDATVNVIIYTAPRCGYCNLAKSFFDKHAIDYFEYDISTSQEGFRQFKEYGGRGVPLIFVGDQRINGYNVKALRIALENKGLL